MRVFVPQDATAIAVGAERVAGAIRREADRRGLDVQIVRNGSRGALWLEPLVEVEVAGRRLAYGRVEESDVPALFDAGFLQGGQHARSLGPTDGIAWLARQTRITFARCGLNDPLCLESYRAGGGWRGLERALAMSPQSIAQAVSDSGLRGRGGAGFPAGIKWATVQRTPASKKYVVCNADEGDSGTFADRLLMEGDPFLLIEGMIIAGLAVGADSGFVYIRSEYPHAWRTLGDAVAIARDRGFLGDSVCGSGRRFDIELRLGGGAYICGEEMALIESLEGKRGVVRAKPPLPAVQGLFGMPTLVHNVLSLAAVPDIVADGPAGYVGHGTGRSRGTLTVQLAGNIRQGGLIEVPFGTSLRTVIEEWGGGTASGRPLRAVQVGGPLGAYLPESMLDLPLDYEAFANAQAMLGHGGIVVFDDTVDMAKQARFAMEFCAIESCGKCTPCRIGSTRGVEVIDRIRAGLDRDANLALLEDLCETLTDGSLCALGGLTPNPVRSAINHFAEDFERTSLVVPKAARPTRPILETQ
jgi:formate dehydrogenase iron-sulfur subunit